MTRPARTGVKLRVAQNESSEKSVRIRAVGGNLKFGQVPNIGLGMCLQNTFNIRSIRILASITLPVTVSV
jgi:hypothetical protein